VTAIRDETFIGRTLLSRGEARPRISVKAFERQMGEVWFGPPQGGATGRRSARRL